MKVLFKWTNYGRVAQKIRINYTIEEPPYEQLLSEQATLKSVKMSLRSLFNIGTVELSWGDLSQSYRIPRTCLPSKEGRDIHILNLNSLSAC